MTRTDPAGIKDGRPAQANEEGIISDYDEEAPVLLPTCKDQVSPSRTDLDTEALGPKPVVGGDRPAQSRFKHQARTSSTAAAPSVGRNALPIVSAELVVAAEDECVCRCKRRKVLFVVGLLVILAITIVVAGVCGGTEACGGGASSAEEQISEDRGASSTEEPKNEGGGASSTEPISERAATITAYINNITLTGIEIKYPPSTLSSTPEEKALEWLIEDDPLQLTTGVANQQLRLQQRYALSTLWFQESPNVWTVSTKWLEDTNECAWHGIGCDNEGQVTEIYLDENNLRGRFPPDLGLLTSLRAYWAGFNNIEGTLPASISRWSQLERFGVHVNLLSGRLPAIQQWTNLQVTNMGGNNLSGPLPEADWSRLTLFIADENQFTALPESLGQWTSLKEIYIGVNDLRGTLPDSIGQWTGLVNFSAYDNHFSGPLPSSIGAWSNLNLFWVWNNALTGKVPESVGAWKQLTSFMASQNSFSGTIPSSVVNWTSIEVARFYSDDFTGSMPFCSSISDFPNLGSLQADCSEVDCPCCFYCY